MAIPLNKPAGILRRIGALISDSLVVIGMLLLASLMFVPLLQHLNAKAMVPSEVGWGWSCIYWSWLLVIWSGFIGYFWTHGGQTVGMKAWRIRVETEAGVPLTWTQALRRLAYAAVPWMPCLAILALADASHSSSLKHLGQGLALLGIAALFYVFVDPQKRTWHDLMSKSRVISLSKLHLQ